MKLNPNYNTESPIFSDKHAKFNGNFRLIKMQTVSH